ncbi:MAG: BrnA antitoxin family protein [Chloroflexi bacterium]|nr:BrnA antitoxin family protein [Chloroflexota bacterium]
MADQYSTGNKTRITIRIDDDVLNWFRSQVDAAGGGNYQTLMNRALREYIQNREQSVEEIVRRVIREELSAARAKAATFKSNTNVSR